MSNYPDNMNHAMLDGAYEDEKERIADAMYDELLVDIRYDPSFFLDEYVWQDDDSHPILCDTYQDEDNELLALDAKRWAGWMIKGGWGEAKNQNEFLHNLFAQPFESWLDFKVEQEMER